ncbi:hypothetical protein [Alicyclobacillus tolerans]|uniref:Uncharacterized protein n=1 Tax=Alicyclobacillus tolerans TaxID=90970 RepID=A0ABT9M044_9BACL|nr:hypothetical protein [Alicyclobacillus tengchongensis]MDP9729888.1 hypothetical protein [Alicyclobacillus tengchongensis]
MEKRKKWWITLGATGLAVVALTAFMTEKALAYTFYPSSFQYGNLVLNQQNQTQIDGGATMTIESPGTESGLSHATVHAFVAHADVPGDAQGNWQIPDINIEGTTFNDGYPMIGGLGSNTYDINSWVSRLDGNINYVQSYIQSHGGNTEANDKSNFQNYDLVDLATVVMTSGGSMTVYNTPTGQYDAEGNEILSSQYTVIPSAPPTAESITVSDPSAQPGTIYTNDPLYISVTSQQNVNNGSYQHHYDAVEIVNNSTGQATWVVGSGYEHASQMAEESGAYGTLTESFQANALPAGNYTAYFYTKDAVHRLAAAPATTTFTVTNSGGGTPTGGGGGGIGITLSASPTSLPTGQSSTLTYNVTGMSNAEMNNNMDYVAIMDESGDHTLSGQNEADSYTTSGSAQATDNTAQTVSYVAELINFNTGQVLAESSPVQVQWTSGYVPTSPPPPPPSISLSPSQSEYLNGGQSATISYTVTNWEPSYHVVILSAGDGTDTWNNSYDTSASGSYVETEHPAPGQSIYVTYIAYVENAEGAVLATAESGTITWRAAALPSITMGASPLRTTSGNTSYISYSVSNMAQGDTVDVTAVGNGTDEWHVTGSTSAFGAYDEMEFPENGNSTVVTYTATVYNAEGQAESTASVTVTWTSSVPSISMSSPAQTTTGQPIQVSYQTQNLGSGDYVVVKGTGGQDMWSETRDTASFANYTEVENPENGQKTVVDYTATVYSKSGQPLAQATTTDTWTSQMPTITLTASPTSMQPGQPSTLTYTVENLGANDTVSVVPDGNGSDMWDVKGQTNATESYRETESPPEGQTIAVEYTATVYDDAGNALTSATVKVDWVNAWTGNVTLTAEPKFLATGQSTTLTATSSEAIPNGYALTIYDASTGQVVASGTSSTLTAPYSSGVPETEQFVAQISDSYENVGSPSNTQTVVWSSLSLSANPQQLPSGQTTTLTVTGENVPNGDFLVLYNVSTGQVVGYSNSTPYTTTVTEPTPQTDQFIAYISSDTSDGGAYASSNMVAVDWYGVTLTVNPAYLPTGQTSTLTATAQDLPSGYVLDIENQTTGQVIATGQPGQTSLVTTQMYTTPLTDQYVAQVVQPSNPTVPNMNVPASGETINVGDQGEVWAGTSNHGVAYWNGSTWVDVGDPNGQGQILALAYDPVTNQVWAGTSNGAAYWNGSQWIDVDSPWGTGVPIQALAYDTSTGDMWASTYEGVGVWNGTTWSNIPTLPGGGPIGLEATNQVVSLAYDFENNVMYASDSNGEVAYWNGSNWISAGNEHGDGPIYYDPTLNRIYAGSYTYGGIGYISALGSNWTTVSNASADWGIEAITGIGGTIYNGAYNNYQLYAWNENQSGASAVTSQGADAISMTIGPKGTVWVGTDGNGIYEYNPWSGSVSYPAPTDVNGSSSITALVSTAPMNFISNSHQILSNIPQETPNPGFSEDTPWNQEVNLQTGEYAEHMYFAPSGQTISSVSASLETNMFGYNGGTYYSNPFIKAFNSSGQQIGIDNIQATFDSPGDQSVHWTPPSGTTSLAFGWVYNSGYNGAINWTAEWSGVQIQLGTGNQYFPYWSFQSMPSYIPQSLFPYQAVANGEGYGFWSSNQEDVPNGTEFFESTFHLTSSQEVQVSVPTTADDFEAVYIDGQPVLQNGYSAGYLNAPNTSSVNVNLSAGEHQVIIEAMNTNGFYSAVNNPARADLQILTMNGQILVPNTPSAWMTTGYLTQLPQGWFSGAVGTYHWTEYVLQENHSQPIYEQQAFSVTTTAQNVAATSTVQSITWLQHVLDLSASPTALSAGDPTTLSVTAPNGAGSQDVIKVVDITTNQVVGTSTPGATNWTGQWTENSAQTDTFEAYLINTQNGQQDAASNSVQVTWSQVPLTLSDAEVYHTPSWQKNLDDYNSYMQINNPSMIRPESDFWAGEMLMFKAKPSRPDIVSAHVTVQGLTFRSDVPGGMPIDFTMPFEIPLTYDAATGYLEGNTSGDWTEWFQYLANGTYTVQFWAKSSDNQIATASASFTILHPWLGGNLGSYFQLHETY